MVRARGLDPGSTLSRPAAPGAAEGAWAAVGEAWREYGGSIRNEREPVSHVPRRSLRILIANEEVQALEKLAALVKALGHEVIARETDVGAIGAVTAHLDPDVALVTLGPSAEHALALIRQIVQEATCPVIALLSSSDPAYVREAARHGIFAYVVDTTDEELQSSLEITLERFAEYHALQGAFGRRAIIEQAKGILMARRDVSADEAFALLRGHSQRSGRRVHDLAMALIATHGLLAPPASPAGEEPGELAAPGREPANGAPSHSL
jgi:response regulator NasT